MFLQGWVNGILINESSVYGTLCIVLLKILNMGLYFSEIDTRGWPYRRQDLLLPFNHSFAKKRIRVVSAWVVSAQFWGGSCLICFFYYKLLLQQIVTI